MKPDETQAYARDICKQRPARKIQTMNTPTFTLNRPSSLAPGRFLSAVLGALLLCATAAQAAEPQQPATKPPLDLSLPQDASPTPEWRNTQTWERQNHKPYGSGYEARGLGEAKQPKAEVITGGSGSATGGGRASGGSGGSGGGSGGSGSSGGRGR